MAKWKEIKNNRIQTFASEVFLWDRSLGVAARVKVPSRPWTKLDGDFSHWMSADGFLSGTHPMTYPYGEKPNDAHFTGSDTITVMEGDDGAWTVGSGDLGTVIL